MRNHAFYQDAIVPRAEDTALPCSDLFLYEARAAEVPQENHVESKVNSIPHSVFGYISLKQLFYIAQVQPAHA